MSRPLFSILIPAYNCESTLLASVSSALSDRDIPVEVVIVDDASTDTTPRIADAISRLNGNVKVFHAERNRGEGPTRNAGLEHITGEWLVLLDSDDLIEPQALSAIADHIKHSSATPDIYIARYFERDVVSNARWRMDECFLDEYAGKGPLDPVGCSDSLFSIVRSVIANKVWNVDYLRRNNLVFQNIPRTGDMYFTLGSLAQAKTIEFLDVNLYEYRRNSTTCLTSTGDRYPTSFAEASEALYGFLTERGLIDTWRIGFLNWFNENTFYNLVNMKSLEGFAALLTRLKEKTFPQVHFDDLRREDALSQANYDRNVFLQEQTICEVLFSSLRMLFNAQEDQFYRAEYHLFNEVNSRREADWRIYLLKDELERTRASLSMKVGLAATLVPRKAKAVLLDKKRQQESRIVFSTYANPTVSVIVPTYNMKQHLWECLDSILGQTFSDFELIIVDDGSTDGTSGECDDYAHRDSRVTVVHQQKSGISVARKSGISLARGEWLVFVNDTDCVRPEFLSTLLGAAIGTGSDIAVCDIQRFSGNLPAPVQPLSDETVVLTGEEVCEREGFHRDTLWGKVYRTDAFEAVRLSDSAVNADVSTQLGILRDCSRVADVGKALYEHREIV